MSSAIDAMLYRPLKSGNQYNGLIPAYQGSQYNFDKESDNSTTYDTLKYMAEWSNKYAYQMKRIAPLLKGRSIQETANNIYQFLYNHFQYKLDGSLQNLFSPSAAWHFRKTGFDCKTYSLLASCILQNLNIKHSFRMVQQAGIMPGEWSHVYVIVPDNNTEYVIDATTHTNKQVSFTKKHDYAMKHLGLASPAVYGLGCACQGTPISRNGLGAPSNLASTVGHFHAFLDELESKGFSREVTSRMLTLVKFNIDNGIDPNMHEILQKAILPNGQLGATSPFSNSFGSYNTPSMSFGSTPSFSLKSNSVLTQPSGFPSFGGGGASSGTSGFGNFMNSGVGSLVGGIKVGGVPVGGVASAVTGLISGNPMAAIKLITSLIPVGKTFGAVFANGFDLSCIGASTSTSETKLWAEQDFPWAMNETLGKGLNEQNLNEYLDTMNYLESGTRSWANDMKSRCSKNGLNTFAEGAKVAKEGVIEGVKAALAKDGIQMIALPITQKSQKPIRLDFKKHGSGRFDYPIERFQIIMPQPQPQNGQNQTGSNTNNGNGENPETKSGSSTPLLLTGALLALKFLL